VEKRLGFIGIIVSRKDAVEEVNRILSRFGKLIRGRIGVPNHEDESAVIGLITEGTNDEIGALTGKLGNLPGIVVKSALAPAKSKGEEQK
jgi:putative iron-only hydrogenase system regulator